VLYPHRFLGALPAAVGAASAGAGAAGGGRGGFAMVAGFLQRFLMAEGAVAGESGGR